MFSVLNGILLKPLPYAGNAQLESIYRSTAQNPKGGISPADFLDLQREMRGYGTIAAYMAADTSLSEPGRPAEMAAGIRITSNFFSTLGTTPQLGRDFRRDEEVHGNDRVLIISQRCWKNRFGGDAGIIGRTVRVDGEPQQIVGVLPPPSTTGGTSDRSTSSGPSASTPRHPPTAARRRSSSIGRRSSTISRVEGERSSPASARAWPPRFPRPMPEAPGAPSRSTAPSSMAR